MQVEGVKRNGLTDVIKRKRTRTESFNSCNQMRETEENNILGFLHARNQMLRAHPNTHQLTESRGLHLIHLLLVTANTIDGNGTTTAAPIGDLLGELYSNNVSLHGTAIQRVTAYFIDALAALSLTRRSPLYDKITAPPTREEAFVAFTELYRASPYYQFAHFTANQSIIEAFEAEEERNNRSLHIVDFDVSYGFQWPSLMQSLSDKAATSSMPISLHITAVVRDAAELVETQNRLANFSFGCPNLHFKFEGVPSNSTSTASVKFNKNSTVVVNMVTYLSTLPSSSEVSRVLENVHMLNPSLVTLVEKQGLLSAQGSGTPAFMQRFMEDLHYYGAMFDSLHGCLPLTSQQRLCIEKNHLGKEIKASVVGSSGVREGRVVETWGARMERAGFEGVEMSSRSVSQAKLLLKTKCHFSAVELDAGCGGFTVAERDHRREISLGWQDRNLITASAWRCAERSIVSLTSSDDASV